MDGKLTVEKARKEPLSRNPFKRNAQVRAIISNPEHVGEDTEVVVNQEVYRLRGKNIIGLNTVSPFLGRRALTNVAVTLEMVEEYPSAFGGNLDIQFVKSQSISAFIEQNDDLSPERVPYSGVWTDAEVEE